MQDAPATPEDVAAAYRLVLGREPDREGFDHYVALIEHGSLTKQQMLAAFLNSAEFMAKECGLKVDLGGVFVVVNPSEPEFGRPIAVDATWEPHIVATITKRLSRGQVFVDVGANVGVMSFKAAQIVGSQGKVIAFEPNEENARFFLRGVVENSFQEFVRLHRLALSDKPRLFSLHGGSNTHLIGAEGAARLVQAIRGDELLAAEPAIHFIKLDIEGHEPFAIRGLTETINRHKPTILSEFNPRCLNDHIGIPPDEFAGQVFELAREVMVIEHDGNTNTVFEPRALMDLWAMKNEEAVRTGFLPEGMLHFDILFTPAR